jgi:hypothetical protein
MGLLLNLLIKTMKLELKLKKLVWLGIKMSNNW